MIVKCLVAGHTGNGPDFALVQVDCNDAQYDAGEHYQAAMDWAMDQDYEGPFVVMDEKDPPYKIFPLLNWESTTTISTPY